MRWVVWAKACWMVCFVVGVADAMQLVFVSVNMVLVRLWARVVDLSAPWSDCMSDRESCLQG